MSRLRPRSTQERKRAARAARKMATASALTEYFPPVHFLAFCEPCGEMDDCTLYLTETTVTHHDYVMFVCEDCLLEIRVAEPTDAR